jgi:hypothetical protein
VVSATGAVFLAALIASVLAGVAAVAMPKTPVPDGDVRSGSIGTTASG